MHKELDDLVAAAPISHWIGGIAIGVSSYRICSGVMGSIYNNA